MADATGPEGLLIPLQFSLEEARASLLQLEAEARKRGASVGEGFGAGAKTGLGGFLKTLQEFKAEQTQQGRQARFFASELMSIVPASDAARGGMEQLLGIFIEGAAGGIGFGLALEGVKLAVSAVTAAQAEATRIADAYAAAHSSVTQAILAGRGVLRDYNREMTDGQKLALDAQTKMVAGLEEVNKAYQDLTESGPSKWDRFWDGNRVAVEKYEQRLAALRDEVKRVSNAMINAAGMASALTTEAAKAAADKRADATIAGDIERAKERAKQLLAENKAEDARVVERIQREAQAELEAANERGATRLAEDAAEERRNQRKIDSLSAQMEAQEYMHQQLMGFYEEEQRRLEQSLQMQAFGSFARSVAGAFQPILTQSAAYSRAMKAAGVANKNAADLSAAAFAAMAQNALASMATEAAGRALFNLALGLSMSAMGNPKAAEAFAAAAEFGIVAGMGAAGAMVIGATRGMTSAERQSVEDQKKQQEQQQQQGGGAREYYSGSSSGGTVTVKETVFIVAGSEFETPSETARRAARTLQLVKDLDLMKRAG